jgi:predicted nucleic-acid-binding Zn-ribbon protein
MSFAGGKFTVCPKLGCRSTVLTTVRESFDRIDRVFVGEQTCDQCGASLLYARRASTAEERLLANAPAQVRGTT